MYPPTSIYSGSLNEDRLYRLKYLNASSLVDGIVLGKIRRCGLVRGVVTLGVKYSPHPTQSHSCGSHGSSHLLL